MPLDSKKVEQLSAKLDTARVTQREERGQKFSYIEGWDSIETANRIFGFDGWSSETHLELVFERERKIGKDQAPGWGVCYRARVRVTIDGATRDGIGTGHGFGRDAGLAHESAMKEAETDALKRALRLWGNQFGLALYDKQQREVFDYQAAEAEAAERAAAEQKARDWADGFINAIDGQDEESIQKIVAQKKNETALKRLAEAFPEISEEVGRCVDTALEEARAAAEKAKQEKAKKKNGAAEHPAEEPKRVTEDPHHVG